MYRWAVRSFLAKRQHSLHRRPTTPGCPTADPVTAKICRKLVEIFSTKSAPRKTQVREVRRILLRTRCQFPDMEAVGRVGDQLTHPASSPE